MKLYVGNLPWSMTKADLEFLFGGVGPVISTSIATDTDSGHSRGFGFVEMDKADAVRAISQLNGHEVNSRALRVNEAKGRPRRSRDY